MRVLWPSAVLLLSACNTFPVVVDPRIRVSPYLSEYRLRGDIALQNDPGGGPQDNAPQDLETFGSGHHEDDVGVRADIGDGFAGIRLDYYRMTMNTSHTGILGDDFGSLIAGDTVRMASSMDEWRLGWTEQVLRQELAVQGHPLDVRLGLGVGYAHRDLAMRMRTDDGARTQNVHHTGDAFSATTRVHAAMKSFAFDFDYAIAPGLVTGDYDGMQQDIEARLSYSVPFQDVTLFAGYRYSLFSAKGNEGGLAYDSDLRLDGYQFGITVSF